MASLSLKAEKCTMCGTSDREWLEDPNAFVAITRSCIGCQRKKAMEPADGSMPRAGDHVVLVSRREADRLAHDPSVPRHGPRMRRRTRRRPEGDDSAG